MRRVVDPILIEDQRVRQRADLEQPVPVGRVPGQARDLEAEHDAGVAQAHFGDQPLKSLPIGRRRARLPEVRVDDDDVLQRPAQGDGMLAQGVLPLGTLGILDHLAERGLADVEIGLPLQMSRLDFLVDVWRHRPPLTRRGRTMLASTTTRSACRTSARDQDRVGWTWHSEADVESHRAQPVIHALMPRRSRSARPGPRGSPSNAPTTCWRSVS